MSSELSAYFTVTLQPVSSSKGLTQSTCALGVVPATQAIRLSSPSVSPIELTTSTDEPVSPPALGVPSSLSLPHAAATIASTDTSASTLDPSRSCVSLLLVQRPVRGTRRCVDPPIVATPPVQADGLASHLERLHRRRGEVLLHHDEASRRRPVRRCISSPHPGRRLHARFRLRAVVTVGVASSSASAIFSGRIVNAWVSPAIA